jgi:hypothetical protein
MTFPNTIDPTDLYCMMSPEALLAHLEALASAIAGSGIEINGEARRGLDEVSERIVEHIARTDRAALNRHLARAQAGLHGGAN